MTSFAGVGELGGVGELPGDGDLAGVGEAEGDLAGVGEVPGELEADGESLGASASSDGLAPGEFEACRLIAAAQPVDDSKSTATNVAGTTPLTPLLSATFEDQSVWPAGLNPTFLDEIGRGSNRCAAPRL